LLGKEKEAGFERIDLIKKLLPVYIDILTKLYGLGAEWVQFDEPFLTLDLSEKEQLIFKDTYKQLRAAFPFLKFVLATYFGRLGDNIKLATSLPVNVLHIDLVRAPDQLDEVLTIAPEKLSLSLGVVDGRNIWKNDYGTSLAHIKKAISVVGKERLIIAPGCSLLHTPFDLDLETAIDPQIKNLDGFCQTKTQRSKRIE